MNLKNLKKKNKLLNKGLILNKTPTKKIQKTKKLWPTLEETKEKVKKKREKHYLKYFFFFQKKILQKIFQKF